MSNDNEFPVTIPVRRPDGTIENVRVGTAVRDGNEFRLTLGELSIGAPAPAARASASAWTVPSLSPSAPPPTAGGMVFPNYGMSKGRPIAGASMHDLEFYANGCRRSLNNPDKARWHDRERVLLAAIEAEIARQRGGGAGVPSDFPAPSGIPSSRRVPEPPPAMDDVPPPDRNYGPPVDEDDDIPF